MTIGAVSSHWLKPQGEGTQEMGSLNETAARATQVEYGNEYAKTIEANYLSEQKKVTGVNHIFRIYISTYSAPTMSLT